ncbi:MAG TPA: TolC family protein [Vicinamibacterales bacterium]|nr:TolC family protein [Vicinamibacterales bacterium]
MTSTPNAAALGLALSLGLVPAIAGAQAAPRQAAPPTSTRPQPAPAPGSTPRTQTPTPAPTPAPAPPATATPPPGTVNPTSGQPRPGLSPVQTAPGAALPPVTSSVGTDAVAARPIGAVKTPGPQITLGQAVDLALTYQPRVALAAQDTLTARAQLREAQGLFDTTFTFAPGADYTQQPVAPGFLKQQLNNRTLMKQLHLGFTRANLQLRDILVNSNAPLPRCPLDFNFQFATDAITLDGLDKGEVAALGINQDQFPFVIADLEQSLGVDLRTFCNGPLNQNPLDAVLFDLSYGRLVAIDQGRPFGLEGILLSGVEAPKEAVRLLAEISEAVAARARLALERLGPLPQDQYTRHVSLRTALNKPWRNGMVTGVELLLESEENNFRDKILDPTFGGAGFPPRFPSSLTFSLLMPLGRGRGNTSVAAQERASVFTVRAREEQGRQVATEEVYRTLLAYIRLIAAQENLKLAQASSERQKVLVGLTDQRVRGGEAARVEGFRAQARAAFVESSVAGAQAELVDARMSLAEAMGIDAATLGEAPGAADRFADVRVDQETVAQLIASAMESRRDRLALDQARQASAALAAGARDDTRRVYDLNFSGGLSQAYESEIFRFLPDEQNPIFSELNPPKQFDETHRYYSPRGYWRGLSGRWEPFVTASISFEIPLGNNAAKGRLAEAQATLRSSEIQYRDRTRLITDNITGVVQTLRAAAEGVQRAREAVDRTTATYEGALAQLRAGELTLIDTLTTEEELLGDQTELLRQQQVYLSTLARLRFESGQLVTFSGVGDPSESLRFMPTEFVVR